MLSRDRLNMDLDRASLNLMVQLLSSDPQKATDEATQQEYARNHSKLEKVMAEIPKTSPLAKDLDLDNISVGANNGICNSNSTLVPSVLGLRCMLRLTKYPRTG